MELRNKIDNARYEAGNALQVLDRMTNQLAMKNPVCRPDDLDSALTRLLITVKWLETAR